MDGDGKADIAAGARFKLEGTNQNGTVDVWSGATGKVFRSWDGRFKDGLFGHAVLPVPDLDNDGFADVIISAPLATVERAGLGVIAARSPASGDLLWEQVGRTDGNFGWDLALAGDLDDDGSPDIFVGAPAGDGGTVYLISGRNGRVMRSYVSKANEQSFGWYVATTDDLDGDSFADLAVGAYMARNAAGVPIGAAHVFSSARGTQLHHWQGHDRRSGFGEIVAALGDLDGDGRGEVIVTAPRTPDRTHSRPGDVYVYSGATGKEQRHWSGKQPGELYGRMAVGAGDLDGDGVDDVAIGAPWYQRDGKTRAGRVEFRSGRTGNVLGELLGDATDGWFGWHIRRAPDPDGLGRPTLLISSLREPVDGKKAVGVLDLYVLRRGGSTPTP